MTLPVYEVLSDEVGHSGDGDLLKAYGGAIALGGTGITVTVNFVATPDGVIALNGSAKAVSFGDPADRLLMGMLRASADALLVGASTLRQDSRHQWVPWSAFPDAKEQLLALRQESGRAATPPPLVVVTASGDLPADHPALVAPETDVVIVTTAKGARALPSTPSRVRVHTVVGDTVAMPELIAAVHSEAGAATILCEGGPHLFGQLLDARLVDELFLTIAPQLSGHDGTTPRPSLVEGVAFDVDGTPRLRLRSVRRAASHLFLRYAVDEARRAALTT